VDGALGAIEQEALLEEKSIRVASKIKVIFVDDDDFYREAVEVELIEHGFSVKSFGDGAEMLTAVAARLCRGHRASRLGFAEHVWDRSTL
jgi:hypothetical protein